MKLLDIHSEVVKAVEEILGPMRDFDIDKDEDVADFSMDTLISPCLIPSANFFAPSSIWLLESCNKLALSNKVLNLFQLIFLSNTLGDA